MRRVNVPLEPGRVYRARSFAAWARNPTVVLGRLCREGALQRLGHGLYYAPRPSLLGPLPPKPAEVMRAFLGGRPYLFTGSDAWNSLGLGTTAVHAVHLVYNDMRTGTFELARQRYWLRRVRFPTQPSAEWFAVDLLNNGDTMDVGEAELVQNLEHRLLDGALDRQQFAEMLDEYGHARARELAQRLAHA